MDNKRQIEIKELTCPFCDYKEFLTIRAEEFNENGHSRFFGIDYWDCPKCGAENDVGLENFEGYFKIFKKFTEINDFNGLLKFCKKIKFDNFMLYSLGKYYIQKKEFK